MGRIPSTSPAPAAGPGGPAPDDRDVHLFGLVGVEPPTPNLGWRCVLIGDERALPAIRRLLAELPGDVVADVFVEVTGLEDMQDLRTEAMAMVRWVPRRGQPHGASLIAAVRQAVLRLDEPGPGDVSVWVSSEATVTRALRSYFVDECGVPPSQVNCCDSWERGVVEHQHRRAG